MCLGWAGEKNKFDAYGYRKLAYKLRKKEDIIVNHNKMYRLCKEEGLLRYRGGGVVPPRLPTEPMNDT
ncbi:IS3 family transposase [Pasteuria penetrans]|uniref:IS3 family transposase n=1 Tax=Pasteuria penetrans TaxID=86005 RepID=UPI0011ED8BCC